MLRHRAHVYPVRDYGGSSGNTQGEHLLGKSGNLRWKGLVTCEKCKKEQAHARHGLDSWTYKEAGGEHKVKIQVGMGRKQRMGLSVTGMLTIESKETGRCHNKLTCSSSLCHPMQPLGRVCCEQESLVS